MRWLLTLVLSLLLFSQAKAEEHVYYCTCRIWDGIPKIWPLHHACVLIADESKTPLYVFDEKGRKINNPDLTYYGSRTWETGFNPEGSCIDLKLKRVDVSPEVVRQRLAAYDRTWNIIWNCQVAAHYAVSPPGKKTIWHRVLRKDP